jgi:ubiquinone/menaquinone biosynthesis C-methylase UbiE
MSKFTDQHYLKTEQYRDSSNLDVRVELHRQFSTNSYGWFPWIFDTLESLPGQAHVLELGCGLGYMWKECVDRIPSGWSITLSDLSDGMIDDAWRNLVVTGRAFKFEQIDAQSIPYPNETFDIVIANHMLFHMPDLPKALAEIRRVLRSSNPVSEESGGYLIATTVGDGHLAEITEWLKQVSPDIDFAPFGSPFTLDNGLEQIKPFFSRVEIKRYDDNLCVTEIDPLMAFIHSTIKAEDFSESALAELRQELEDILSKNGEIFISKDSGLFKAVK